VTIAFPARDQRPEVEQAPADEEPGHLDIEWLTAEQRADHTADRAEHRDRPVQRGTGAPG
jgi:hypothetical protein